MDFMGLTNKNGDVAWIQSYIMGISWGYSWGAVGVVTGYGPANNPGKLGYNITL